MLRKAPLIIAVGAAAVAFKAGSSNAAVEFFFGDNAPTAGSCTASTNAPGVGAVCGNTLTFNGASAGLGTLTATAFNGAPGGSNISRSAFTRSGGEASESAIGVAVVTSSLGGIIHSWLPTGLVATDAVGISAVQFQRQLGTKRHETAFQTSHQLRPTYDGLYSRSWRHPRCTGSAAVTTMLG